MNDEDVKDTMKEATELLMDASNILDAVHAIPEGVTYSDDGTHMMCHSIWYEKFIKPKDITFEETASIFMPDQPMNNVGISIWHKDGILTITTPISDDKTEEQFELVKKEKENDLRDLMIAANIDPEDYDI